jgi:hypothetical protein
VMNKRAVALGVLAALLLPILLALAAYFVSANSFASTTQAVRAPRSKIGKPRSSPTPKPSESDNASGKCAEAEHANDPACAGPSPSGSSDDSGKSGSGVSGSDDSGSGSSGESGLSTSGSGSSGGSGSGSGSGGSGDSGSSGGDD